MTAPTLCADHFEVWDLDPGEYAFEVACGFSGPYPAERAEVVSAAGRSILVAHIQRHGTPRVVRCERALNGAWVVAKRIAEDVQGREAEAFAEMLGYARAALEQHSAAEAARALARAHDATCVPPSEPAPALGLLCTEIHHRSACGLPARARERLDMAHLRDGRGTPGGRRVLLCSADGRTWVPSTAPGFLA